MRWILGFVFTAAVGGLGTTEDKPADAAKQIEGTYTMTEYLINGKPSPKAKEIKVVEVKAGVISIKANDKNDEQDAKFTLDPSKKPMQIDLKAVKADSTIYGIYKTMETDKGLELTIAFIHDGGDGDGKRPKDFKGEGKDEVVFKLLRKK